MASTHGSSQSEFDDRLTEALNSTLISGEEVADAEVGDQGQAIVLTGSRILVLKAGLAATGELNGHKAGAFPLDNVVSVNLRKGPLGAVIQIVAQAAESADGARPDNVVVFTGPGRVKKAEAFAAAVESKTGKTVNRIDPLAKPDSTPERAAEPEPVAVDEQHADEQHIEVDTSPEPQEIVEAVEEQAVPEPPKAGRVYKPLAEEMYGQMTEPEPAPPVQSAPAIPVVEPTPAEISAPLPATEFDLGPVDELIEPLEESQPEPELELEAEQEQEPEPEKPNPSPYHPNPNLPKPMRRRQKGPSKILVTLGVLAALMLVGMAVIAPLRNAPSPMVTRPAGNANDLCKVQLQLRAVANYRSDVANKLAKADAEAASFIAAVRSGSKSSIISCSRLGATDRAWTDLSDLDAPPGLASAKQDMMDGLVARKNAMSIAVAAVNGGSAIDANATITQIDAAEKRIRRGLTAIDAAKISLQRQISKSALPGKNALKAAPKR